MFDVNQITTTLRGMGDRALQQYAMMNKANPYILSLAVSESNQRKQLRTAAQARNMAPQPKVTDAAIAGMSEAPAVDAMGNVTGMASGGLPEDQGIARIPAPNIQRMADGGIAGFDESTNAPITTHRLDNMGNTDGMFNYAQDGGGVMRMAGGGHVPRYQGNTMDGSVVGGIPGFQAVQPRAEFTQPGSPENQTPWERFTDYMGDKKKQALLAEIAARINQGIARPEEIALYNSERIKAGDKAATEAKYPSNTATRAKDFPGVKPSYEKMSADAGAAPPPPPPSAAPAPQANLPTNYAPSKAPTTEDAAALGDKFFNAKERTSDIKRQVLQEQIDADRAKENSIDALKAFNEKQGPAYAGYEQALKKEELQDASDKDKAGLQALFKGFLAIAAGESPRAAVNIAKGSMVGLEEYSGAMKEFKKSAKERNKEMQNIEQARRSEERGDFKEVRMYEDKADAARQASARFGIAAINDITNAGGKASADIFNTMASNTSRENVARMQESGQNARTMAQINAPSGIEKIVGRMQTDPKFAEAYKNYASIGPEAKGYEAELQAYLKNPMMLKATNPDLAAQFDAIIKQRMLTPTSKPTGPVRD